jgi:hypothetical protein
VFTIPELASTYLQGWGFSTSSIEATAGKLPVVSSNANLRLLTVGATAGVFTINGAVSDGPGPITLSTGILSTHNRSNTNVESFDDSVSINDNASAASANIDQIHYGGDTGGYASTNLEIGYFNKVEWSDAEVAEFEGILQTWLTAVGR